MKTLRKEPERRYASARELAEDIRRHLEGRPVLARPDTAGYRLGKFVRVTGVASAAALVALVAVVGGLAGSLWQWRRAEAAHTEAERRFADVRRLAGSLLFEVHDAIEVLPGSTTARALIVKRGVEYLDSLAASSVDPALRAELAAGYLRLGDVQGRGGDASLGDAATARESYRKAVRLAEKGLPHRAEAPLSSKSSWRGLVPASPRRSASRASGWRRPCCWAARWPSWRPPSQRSQAGCACRAAWPRGASTRE